MAEDFYAIAARVSNWGRWGKNDQRGTLNLVTPEVLRRAAKAVRQGKLFRVGLDFGPAGPQGGPGPMGRRFNPQLYMSELHLPFDPALGDWAWSDDVVQMPLQAATQWDALAHVEYDGKIYNGFDAQKSISAHGANHNGIEHAASPGIMSRGVLLDLARWKGVDRLEGTVSNTPDDLDAVCLAQGVSVERGDIVLIRTGHITWFTQEGDRDMLRRKGQPGLSKECALWLRDRDVVRVSVTQCKMVSVSLPLTGDSHGDGFFT